MISSMNMNTNDEESEYDPILDNIDIDNRK